MKAFLLCVLLSCSLLAGVGAQGVKLAFNQPFYASGDTAYFVLVEPNQYNDNAARIVQVALVDGDRLIRSFWIKSQHGISAGYVPIHKGMNDGCYGIYFFIAGEDRGKKIYAPLSVAGSKDTTICEQGASEDTSPFDEFSVRYPETVHVRDTVKVVGRFARGIWQRGNVAVTVTHEPFFKSDGRGYLYPVTEQDAGTDLFVSDKYVTVSGTVVFPGTTMSDSSVISLFLKDGLRGTDARIKPNGRFQATLAGHVGEVTELYYEVRTGGKRVENARMHPDSTVVNNHSMTQRENAISEYPAFAETRNAVKENYAFSIAQLQAPREEVRKYFAAVEDELNGFDLTVRLADYQPFASVAEVVKEIIPMVFNRRRDGRETVRIYLKERSHTADADPLYVIDGHYTRDTDFFLKIPVDRIEEISVIQSIGKRSRFGSIGRDGVILVRTKGLDVNLMGQLESHTVPFFGIQRSRIPMGSGQVDFRTPDLRTCLYWNPRLAINSENEVQFTFVASDVPGVFDITFVGVDGNGDVFELKKSLNVVQAD